MVLTSFNELVSRFEEPDDRNRWDSPLFTVLSDDTSVSCDAIWDAVIVRLPKPPNQSTVVVRIISRYVLKDY